MESMNSSFNFMDAEGDRRMRVEEEKEDVTESILEVPFNLTCAKCLSFEAQVPQLENAEANLYKG